MPPPPDLSFYRLSDEESKQILESKILPEELSGNETTSPNPLALLIIGQTGAGKSSLSPDVLEALQSTGRRPAYFIADTFKVHHPSYTALLQKTPHLASPATSPDARRWLEMAASEAARRRIDVLVESASRNPEDFMQLARIFRKADYRIEVVVLAVPAALSRLGILVRYYQKLPEAQLKGLPLRLTPKKVHDDSYEGLVQAAAFLDQEGLADQVLLVRRGGLVSHSILRNQSVQQRGSIAKALQQERERPLSDKEQDQTSRDFESLALFDDTTGELAEIKDTIKPLLSDHYVDTSSNGKRDSTNFSDMLPLALGGHLVGQIDNPQRILRLGLAEY